MKKLDARKLDNAAINDLRLRAIELYKKGYAMTAISELLSVSYSAVRKWVRLFKQGREAALKVKKRGKPEGSRELTPEQEKWICKNITTQTPDKLSIPFGLWTSKAVQMLLEERFGISRSDRHVRRYLRQWGFSPQKPLYKAYEQDGEEVKEWLQQTYPTIERKARREGAVIQWGDETGMRSTHQAGTSWAPVGKTPVVERTGKRFSLNMIAAITNQGAMEFMVFKAKFNSEKFIEFLAQLIKYKRKKIHLIVDAHPAHLSKKTSQWVEKNKERIELHFLPFYSPELNPTEYLNQDIKSNALGKHRAANSEELKDYIEDYLSTRNVANYFKHPKVQFAA